MLQIEGAVDPEMVSKPRKIVAFMMRLERARIGGEGKLIGNAFQSKQGTKIFLAGQCQRSFARRMAIGEGYSDEPVGKCNRPKWFRIGPFGSIINRRSMAKDKYLLISSLFSYYC